MKYLFIWTSIGVSIFQLTSDNAIILSKVLNFGTTVKAAWCYETDLPQAIEELERQLIRVHKHYNQQVVIKGA